VRVAYANSTMGLLLEAQPGISAQPRHQNSARYYPIASLRADDKWAAGLLSETSAARLAYLAPPIPSGSGAIRRMVYSKREGAGVMQEQSRQYL
jgi:hypothetical protein